MRLIGLLLIAALFCQCRQHPEYLLDDIQGNWIRIESTNYRSDSMQIDVVNDAGIIIGLPVSSNFILGQTKWLNISSVPRGNRSGYGDFILNDLSSNGIPYEATIFLDNDTIFLNNISSPTALGGKQVWVRN